MLVTNLTRLTEAVWSGIVHRKNVDSFFTLKNFLKSSHWVKHFQSCLEHFWAKFLEISNYVRRVALTLFRFYSSVGPNSNRLVHGDWLESL